MLGFEYLKGALENFYKEHSEKFINQKANEIREEAQQELLIIRRLIALILFSCFLIITLAYF